MNRATIGFSLLIAAMATGCSVINGRIDDDATAGNRWSPGLAIREVQPTGSGTVRLRWMLPLTLDADEFFVYREFLGSEDEVLVGRVPRVHNRVDFQYHDRLEGGGPEGRYRYRIERRLSGAVGSSSTSRAVWVSPSLATRIWTQLLAHGVEALQLNEWTTKPHFEGEEPIPLRRLGIPERPDLDLAIERAQVEVRETPPIEGWRLESTVEWQLKPWISHYAFEPRYRLLRVWTVTLHRKDTIAWRGSEVIGYGIERLGAPYQRVRRWEEEAVAAGASPRVLTRR